MSYEASWNTSGGGAGAIEDKSQLQLAPIVSTSIGDTNFVSFRIHIPANFTLKIWALGVQNDANNAPAGLTAEVEDETNSTTLISENSKRTSQSDDPIESVDGSVDVAFRIRNETGNPQNASATFAYTVERQ